MQTDETLVVACCVRLHTMLHVAACCCVMLEVVACCCVLLGVVACFWELLRVVLSCCAKLETGQTFEPTTPNSSLVP